jgi:hypothetical protein
MSVTVRTLPSAVRLRQLIALETPSKIYFMVGDTLFFKPHDQDKIIRSTNPTLESAYNTLIGSKIKVERIYDDQQIEIVITQGGST